MQKANRPFQKL